MNVTPKLEGAAEAKSLLQAMGKNAKAATQLWANSVGEHMQRTMRVRLPDRFHLRGTASQFSNAIVFQRARMQATGASTREIQAVLRVGSDGAGKSTATFKLGRLLARYEEADTRSSTAAFRTSTGRNFVAGFFIPAPGLRTPTTNPPRRLYPTNIGAQMRIDAGGTLTYSKGTRKGSKAKGNGESYFATEKGIFRRRHSAFGSAKPDPIWWFSKRVRTPARLRLWESAQEVFDRFALSYAQDAVDLIVERSR